VAIITYETVSLAQHPDALEGWVEAYGTWGGNPPPRPTRAIRAHDSYHSMRGDAAELKEQQAIWDRLFGAGKGDQATLDLYWTEIELSEADEVSNVQDTQAQAEKDFAQIAIAGYDSLNPPPAQASGFLGFSAGIAQAAADAQAFQTEQSAIAAGAFTEEGDGPPASQLGQIGADKVLSDQANLAWVASDTHLEIYRQTVGLIQDAGLQVSEQAEAARRDFVYKEWQNLKKTGLQKVGDWIAQNGLTILAVVGAAVGGVLTGGAIAIAAGCAAAVGKASAAKINADARNKVQEQTQEAQAAKVEALYAYQRQCYDSLVEAKPAVLAYDESQRKLWVTAWIQAHGGSAAPAPVTIAAPPQHLPAPTPAGVLGGTKPPGILHGIEIEAASILNRAEKAIGAIV
jgi:hypothetical protein